MARRADIVITAIDRASPTFGKIRLGLSALAATAVAAGAVAIGRQLVQGIVAATQAAAESEAAQAKLAQAIAKSGQSVAGTLPSLQAFNSALADQTGIDDDLIAANQAMLVSIGKLRGEGLERATKAAVDLAAATGKPLDQAFTVVAKAAIGNTTALGKLGIKFQEGATAAQTFTNALGAIEGVAGGAAAARLLTFEGALEDTKRLFGELSETIGGPFLEVGTILLNDFVRPLTKELGAAAEETDGFRGTIFSLSIQLAELLRPIELVVQNTERFARAIEFALAVSKGQAPIALMAGSFALLAQGIDLTTEQTDELIRKLEEAAKKGPPKLPPTSKVVEGDDLGKAAEDFDAFANAYNRFQASQAAGVETSALLAETYAEIRAEVEASIAAEAEMFAELEGQHEETIARIGETVAAAQALAAQSLDVGRTIRIAMGQIAVQGALDLGSAFADAAFGADVAWGQFFRNFMRQIAAAIAQALVLKALSVAFPGLAQFFDVGGFGARAPVRAAAGFMVPGNPNRGDVVPAFLRPGELVLNRDQQRELLSGGASGPTHVYVELGPNLRQIATAVSVEVNRGSARLVATETRRPIRNRRS